MTINGAIRLADGLRPNGISAEVKCGWMTEVDGTLAVETMGVDAPIYAFPQDGDKQLLMLPPYDNLYALYLCAMIDHYQQETTLYANDSALYNAAMQGARAHWRRTHMPPSTGDFQTM